MVLRRWTTVAVVTAIGAVVTVPAMQSVSGQPTIRRLPPLTATASGTPSAETHHANYQERNSGDGHVDGSGLVAQVEVIQRLPPADHVVPVSENEDVAPIETNPGQQHPPGSNYPEAERWTTGSTESSRRTHARTGGLPVRESAQETGGRPTEPGSGAAPVNQVPVNQLRRNSPFQLINIPRHESVLRRRPVRRLPATDQDAAPPTGERSALIRVPPSETPPGSGTGPDLPPPADAATYEPPLIPNGFVPWWQNRVAESLRPHAQREATDVSSLVLNALVYSQHIHALREQPRIREMAIFEAEAEFDPHAFMESKLVRTSEPVGDELTTGGPPRFRESDWHYSAGMRKKTRRGGRFEVSQRLGYLDNNSLFLVPTQQGNGRLTLSFEQPLLRGAGEYYNTSLVLLAELDAAIAESQTARDLEQYLLEVYKAYWDLFLERASLLQMQRSLERAQTILAALERRQDFDSLRSQIVIAQAAVATRRSELVRSSAAVENAQARIAALVNLPGLSETRSIELIPASLPTLDYAPVDLDDAIVTALTHRAEVDEAMQQLDAARVRLDVSQNELLPALSLVLETYVGGLEGDSRVGRAWLNQFSKGEPSYTAGLLFEVPLYNRAAAALNERRHREVRQLIFRFNALMANLRAEVEVAVREVETSFREMQSRYASMQAAEAEAEFMTQRWELLPGDDRAASFLLEDLLAAQNRLADEEAAFVDAQISYATAQAELKRVMGVLMNYELELPEAMPPAQMDPFFMSSP